MATIFYFVGPIENHLLGDRLKEAVAYLISFCATLLWSHEKLQRFLMLLFVFVFWVIMVLIPIDTLGARSEPLGEDELWLAVAIADFLPMFAFFAILSFAPLKAVNNRLSFAVIGMLLLIALNKMSVLGVQHFLEAPKVG